MSRQVALDTALLHHRVSGNRPKPIPTVAPPRTLLGCRQGCYRQAIPLLWERRRLSGRYGQAIRHNRVKRWPTCHSQGRHEAM